MILALEQARYAPSTLELIVLIAMFSAIVDVITHDDGKPGDDCIRLLLNPVSWLFTISYSKIKGTTAPAWMPLAVAFVIYAGLLFAAGFFS